MNIEQLCDWIRVPEGAKRQILQFADTFDFSTIEKQLIDIRDYANIATIHEDLQKAIGPDEDGMKILACLFQAAVNTYDMCQKRGIPDEIFHATMSCFTTSLEAEYARLGKYFFGGAWWLSRLAGGHYFRIQGLEYELKREKNECVVAMHIPDKADFSPKAIDASLEASRQFMKQCFPEVTVLHYSCRSWLLSPDLKNLLNADSNILRFASRFENLIVDEEPTDDIMPYVFHEKVNDYADLPENTSLQRNLKRYLMNGGIIRKASGFMKAF